MLDFSGRMRMSRRALLQKIKALSLVAGASTLVSACEHAIAPISQQPITPSTTELQSTTQPTTEDTAMASVQNSTTARIAFVKTTDRAEGVRRALQLFGLPDVANKNVLLKPNFNSADAAPGSTHPDVLRTLIETLWAEKAATITVADRSGMGDTRRVMEQIGALDLAKELDFQTTVLDELERNDWELIEQPGSHWKQGFPIARCCRDSDVVVQACCLKTHRYGGHFTLSLKNSVGLVAKFRPGDSYNYMNELHSSPHQRRMIAEINAAYTPSLIVMDGVEAFTTGGPDNGNKVASNVVLVASDRVAIDAVGVAILRYFGTTPEVSRGAIFDQEQIARAVELGLGVSSPAEIELLTADAESEAYAAEIEKVLHAL